MSVVVAGERDSHMFALTVSFGSFVPAGVGAGRDEYPVLLVSLRGSAVGVCHQ